MSRGLGDVYKRQPIRSRIPALRIGMAGIDLSPLILIVGFNFVQPYILRVVC